MSSRASEPLVCLPSRPRRRATSRAPATFWVWATSPPATSPKRTTPPFAAAEASSPIETWPSWSTPGGLIPARSGSTRCPGGSGACSILSRWAGWAVNCSLPLTPQWSQTSHWFYVGFPPTKSQYGNPMIYVTENGVSEKMMCTELCDEWRIQYFRDYINEMLKGRFSIGVNTPLWFSSVTVACGVSQRSRMELTWGATPPGRCLTSLSGMKATPRDSAYTTWTSGTKTSHATPKPLSSSISALLVPMDFPIRER